MIAEVQPYSDLFSSERDENTRLRAQIHKLERQLAEARQALLAAVYAHHHGLGETK